MTRIPGPFRIPAFYAVFLAAGAFGCGGEDGGAAAPEAVRVDSAGVEIVTTPMPAADVPVFAQVDSMPTLRIGALDGRPEEQFGSVSDVLPLPDGGVAVLDGQAAEIRLFDGDGTYRSTLGSKGEGPGEFQSPSALGLMAGDTLAVYDRRSRRVTRFAPDGTMAQVVTLVPDGSPLITRASFLPDGRAVGQSRWVFAGANGFTIPAEGKDVLSLDSAAFVTFDRDGAVSDTLAITPSYENIRRIERSDQAINIYMRPAAFGHQALFAPSISGVWLGYNDRFELAQYDPADGRLVRIVRAPGLDRPRTDVMEKAIRSHAVEQSTSQDRAAILSDVDGWMDLSPKPDTVPAYDRLVVDDAGRLWARSWSGTDPSARWWVFSPTGDLLGSVDLKDGMTLYAVRCGEAWGVVRDDLDVSYVVRYGLDGVDDPTGACVTSR